MERERCVDDDACVEDLARSRAEKDQDDEFN